MPATELEPVTRDIQCMINKVRSLYKDGHTAYWLPPLVLMGKEKPIGRIKQGDSVIFCCRRGEREIQLTKAFTDQHFKGFSRKRLQPLTFVPLTLYHPDLIDLPVAFTPHSIQQTLGEALSLRGLAQFHIAEQEKYSHVTYFFNGGRADSFPGEIDQVVPSFPDEPLRAPSILVETLGKAITQETFPFIILNIASGDLVGHYTDLEPKVACAETVDHALGEILEIARDHDYWTAVTADHGLLEDHGLPGSTPNTSHTIHPVPFVLVSPQGKALTLIKKGILADVAPTLLALLGIPGPEEMTGRQLIRGEVPRVKRVMLVILDGWGLGKKGHVNPIELAQTPHWDRLSRLSIAKLEAFGEAVGLLPNLKGNSEAGHMNLGADRVVLQDDVRIQEAIESGTFMDNPSFHRAINDVKVRNGSLHLLGILSQTSSHGSMDYVIELLRLAKEKGLADVLVHLITDGRSSRSERVPMLLDELGKEMKQIGIGRLVTLVGRGFALDRGGDYENKTRLVYNALVLGDAITVPDRS